MDFDDTKEEAAFRAEARGWLEANARPRREGAAARVGLPTDEASQRAHVDSCRRWQRTLFEGGWAGITWPKAFGGRGGSPVQQMIFSQEEARFEVSAGALSVGLAMVGPTLMAWGTPAQQERHLAAMLRGDALWCQLFSEPGAGSDLPSLTTRAERDGDGWRLTGEKVWCSNGHIADWGICLARSDPDAPAHRGVSFFLVDMRTPGVECRPLRQMTGAREFDQVVLDGVALPGSALLGEPGGGWAVAMSTLTHERNHIGASIIGLQQRLASVARAARPRGGADLDRAIALWCRGQIAGALKAQHERLGPTGASLMKLAVAELAFETTDLAARLAGPAAQLTGPESTALIAAPGSRIAGGTSQVQKTIVAERLLGMPKEPAGGDRPAR